MQPARIAVSVLLLALPAVVALADVAPDRRPTWFIFLETGRPTPDDKEAVGRMQAGHIENFKRLFGEKKLFAAGPLKDPDRKKRGIVVVKADTRKEIDAYFQPDDYVREGYMVANAVRCVAHAPLNSENIDPEGIEEVRIIQISRQARKASPRHERESDAFLQSLIDNGTVGAWYALDRGPVSDVLFSRNTDTDALQEIFAAHPALKASSASKDSRAALASQLSIAIWPQWIGKGVVK